MTNFLHPADDQMAALATSTHKGPIYMLNLLKFHDQARYKDHHDDAPCSGREAYKRYTEAILPFLETSGGKMEGRWFPKHMVIGPDDKHWHEAFVVTYPSKEAFLTMAMHPDYIKIARHRTAALEDSRLILMAGASS